LEPLRNLKLTCVKTNITNYEESNSDSGNLCIISEDEGVYTPRNAEDSPLYQTVVKTLETFLADHQQRYLRHCAAAQDFLTSDGKPEEAR